MLLLEQTRKPIGPRVCRWDKLGKGEPLAVARQGFFTSGIFGIRSYAEREGSGTQCSGP